MTHAQAETSTRDGVVRGRIEMGVAAFKGIPYGASTAGGNRFRPPQPVAPWSGVRDALQFGPDAPQPQLGLTASQNNLALPHDEDCLRVNVWTPGVDAKRRPILFWLHGGGFYAGSASGAWYDGANLARNGDVVVISINHRLGALGFLHLHDMGDARLAQSVNLGMLDIVQALHWVRENAAAFGGDAGNVTLFGESGGGRKVTTLLAMPMAKGLFHKAIVQSGPAVFMNDRAACAHLATRTLQLLGLGSTPPAQLLGALQALPVAAILDAQAKASAEFGQNAPGLAQVWAACADGNILPRHPFSPEAPAVSDDIPVLAGYNDTEATLFMGQDKGLRDLDEAGLARRAKDMFGDDADRLLHVYREAHPDASCSDLLAYLATGRLRYPIDTIKLAERKARRAMAPVWLYTLTWRTPASRGSLRTPHALEIPFVFDNVENARDFVGPGDAPQRMAEIMSSTWLAFARTGHPDNAHIPAWPTYDTAQRQTMVFDLEPRVEADFGRHERMAWDARLYPAGH